MAKQKGVRERKTKAQLAKAKDYAKLLYLSGVTNQKDLAKRVEVSVTSINSWINEGNWEMHRAGFIMTRKEELRRLVARLTFWNDSLDTLEKEYPTATDSRKGKIVTECNKIADTISKISSTIRTLEQEKTVDVYMDTFPDLILYIKAEDPELAIQLTLKADEFIQDHL